MSIELTGITKILQHPPNWVTMKGTRPIVNHQGSDLEIRRHDIYFLFNTHMRLGMTIADFNKLDVNQEPYFRLIRGARRGDAEAIIYLREFMNILHQWGLYGERKVEFEKEPQGLLLDDQGNRYRTSDKNIITTLALLQSAAPRSTETELVDENDYKAKIIAARSGDAQTALWLSNINGNIAELYQRIR